MNTTPLQMFVRHAPSRLRPLQSRRKTLGFTLTELMTTMAVAAVLLTVSVPSMSRLITSARLTDASNAFLSSILLARSEAIKRNSRVALCKSANGVSCATAGGWEQGWIVFHDANNDGNRDSDEAIIERFQGVGNSLRLTGNAPVATYVSFQSTGRARLVGGAFQAGTVIVCTRSAQVGEAREIILSAAGRPRVHRIEAVNCA